MSELLTELLSLTKTVESLERRGQEIRNAFRKHAPGKHTRKAYRAVRLVRRKEAK